MSQSANAAAEFCPTGTLRAALNYGNRVLANRDDTGQPSGITLDFAHRLASEPRVDLTFVPMDRAETNSFSDPHVQIES